MNKPELTIRKFGNLLEVSSNEGERLSDEARRALEPVLSYTYQQKLYGTDKKDPITGIERSFRFEDRQLFRYDQTGRLVCGAGLLSKINKTLAAAGYTSNLVIKQVPRERPNCYETDWQSVVETFEFRARQDECLCTINDNEYGVIDAATGFGKCQPLSSKVQTPTGPVNMGSLKIGDEVCTPDGSSAKVIGVYPQGIQEIFRITFSDGSYTECTKEHLWLISSIAGHWSNKVVDTEYIKKNVKSPNGKLKLSIPIGNPLALNKQKTTIPPYTLGVWLGDGCGVFKFVTADAEIAEKVQRSLDAEYTLSKLKPSVCATQPQRYSKANVYNVVRVTKKKKRNKYSVWLEELGLKGKRSYEKFIPDNYLYNSIENRTELLKGLLDTDGHVTPGGSISYSSTSEKLITQVQWLVESLGGRARLSNRVSLSGRVIYYCGIEFNNGAKFIGVSRKKDRVIKRTKYKLKRIVTSVESISNKPCQCILIDHPDHLYQTDHCIVTHNTLIMAMTCVLYPNAKIHVVTRRKDIVAKTCALLTKYIPNVGQVGGGKNYEGDRVTVFTADSLHHSDGDADILLCDEAHELLTPLASRELAKYRYSRNYAFSATTDSRMDNADAKLESLFGTKIFELSYQEAVKLNLVVPIQTHWISIKLDQNPCAGKKDVPKKRWGLWRNAQRNLRIAEKAKEFKDDQVLILVETVEHAVYLGSLLPDFTLCYADMSSEDLEMYKRQQLLPLEYEVLSPQGREALRRSFESGQARKVIATDVWSTGVDFVGLQVLIRADARSSDIMDVQAPGRVCRIGQKDFGILVDCLDEFDPGFALKARGRMRNYKAKGWEQILPGAVKKAKAKTNVIKK